MRDYRTSLPDLLRPDPAIRLGLERLPRRMDARLRPAHDGWGHRRRASSTGERGDCHSCRAPPGPAHAARRRACRAPSASAPVSGSPRRDRESRRSGARDRSGPRRRSRAVARPSTVRGLRPAPERRFSGPAVNLQSGRGAATAQHRRFTSPRARPYDRYGCRPTKPAGFSDAARSEKPCAAPARAPRLRRSSRAGWPPGGRPLPMAIGRSPIRSGRTR